MTWQSFPWGSVGAVAAIIGLGFAALKLAVLWGANKQLIDDNARRLVTLERKADGVPDEVTGEVSKRYLAQQSESAMLRQHLLKVDRQVSSMQRLVDRLKSRCDTIHGPPSQVVMIEDVEDSGESLSLAPPSAAGKGEPNES